MRVDVTSDGEHAQVRVGEVVVLSVRPTMTKGAIIRTVLTTTQMDLVEQEGVKVDRNVRRVVVV